MDNDTNSPVIIIISHVVPFPPAAGNEIRILNMMKWLKQQGYRIVLLLNSDPIEPDIIKALKEVVYAVHFRDEDIPSIKLDMLKKSQYNYSNIIIEKLDKIAKKGILNETFLMKRIQRKAISNATKQWLCPRKLIQLTNFLCEKYKASAVLAEYIFTTPCLDVVGPGILKIIDTHDMFSRKKEQVIKYGVEDPLPCTRREERRYLLKSDIIIAIQEHEAKLFKKLVPERNVIVTEIDYPIVNKIDNSQVIPNTILIVGSANPLNIHGLNEFYQKCWPIIRNKNASARLYIIGKIQDKFQPNDERINILGWVEDLNKEYQKACVVINPIFAGTGLKIKSVEPLCQGKPLVSTPNGVEGLTTSDNNHFMVAGNWHNFADAVLMLLESEEKRLNLQQRALDFAKNRFTTDCVYASLAKTLKLNKTN